MKVSRNSRLALKIVSGFYLICSFLGFPLYTILPPVLASVGARLHAYLMIIAAFSEGPISAWLMVQIALALVLLLMIIITGVIAIVKNRFGLYSIMVALDNVFTLILLFSQDAGVYDFTAGILVNLAYCIWILVTAFVKTPASNATSLV